MTDINYQSINDLNENLNELSNTIEMLLYIGIGAIVVFVFSFIATMIVLCKMDKKIKERDDKMVNLLSYDSLDKKTYEGTEKNII
tara:strand:+ start:286 stop:540 length:255 start_codon:yes stop_codon:yes gene_type:complete